MVFARLTPLASPSTKANGLSTNSSTHPIELTIDIESPPCVMYGPAMDSAGAIISGLLTLRVKDPYVKNKSLQSTGIPLQTTASNGSNGSNKRKSGLLSFSNLSMSNSINTSPQKTNDNNANLKILSGYKHIKISSVTLSLVQRIVFQKPFVPDSSVINSCVNCKTKTTKLKTWNIQSESIEKSIGKHSYPFSYLIPGSVPSTCSLGLSAETQIKYELVAVATYIEPKTSTNGTRKERKLQLSLPVPVTRSILRGPDKNSLRVFPPTELTAAAVLPNVVYPKSTFPLEMKLDGVSSSDRRWRMRKLSWRIEETTRVRSNACDVHKKNLSDLEKHVKQKEIERNKKPAQAIKRYGDIGPQIRVAVSSPDNMPLQRMRNNHGAPPSSNLSSIATGPSDSGTTPQPSSRRNPNGIQDRDDQDDEDSAPFIHPSDDALRQEITQQQERARQEQLKEEFKNNNSTLFTEEVRIIAKSEMKSGWKTDFDNNGKIELVTDIDLMSLNSGVSNPIMHATTAKPHIAGSKPPIGIACDIQDPQLGIYVSHILAVEIVVAEETLQYSNGQPLKPKNKNGQTPTNESNQINSDQRLAELSPMFANRNTPKVRPVRNSNTSKMKAGGENQSNSKIQPKIVSVPTGAARVLRMQFRLLVTERSGLGISWDEEVPPIYQDVKQSAPPTYENIAVIPLRNYKENLIDDFEDETPSKTSIPRLPMRITPPPMAHHSNNLSSVKSPPLEHVISLQGNVPYRGQILTPSNTRNAPLRNVADFLDPDRITQ